MGLLPFTGQRVLFYSVHIDRWPHLRCALSPPRDSAVMALPNIHNPTNPITYIARRDSIWNLERINYELEVIDGDRDPDENRPAVIWDNATDHPVVRYRLGETRYDLATVEPWFVPGEAPAKFHLRRLSRSQRNNLLALEAHGQRHNAFEAAFRLGCRKIEGVPGLNLSLRVQKQKQVNDADMKKIETLLGRDIIHEVGEAVMRASGDLTAPEAERSDCGPGSSD